ncbi:helix-turn-helix domain-containing protein [Pinisolibacter sp.]|uniref:helix-turn-helix domain-containing protein n=1 Tax=Pinisolibacter sp. TaxID=2172024 RepID=UPI002FDD78DE
MNVSLRAVIAAVEGYCELVPGALQVPTRPRHVADARHLAQALSRRLTSATDSQIGRALGGLDHRAVAYGAEKIERLLPSEPGLREAVDVITATVTSVVERDLLAPTIGADRDVLEVALAVAAGRMRPTDIATADIVAMACCLVGHVRALEAADEAAAREAGGALIEAVGALVAARDTLAKAEHTRGERGARDAFEATWDRLARLHSSLKDA